MTATPPPLRGRIPQIDGLRGLAVLAVVLFHYFATTPTTRRSALAYALATLRLTWSGVDLFFVLSGFLIGGILVDARTSKHYFGTFYARRFFRIVPAYAAVCGLYAAGWLLGGGGWAGGAGPWLYDDPPPWYAFALFIPNVFIAIRGTFMPLTLGVMWSLGVEEQFYATLPLLVRWASPARLVPILLAVIALVPLARTVAYFALPHGGTVAYSLMPFRADSLLLGVVAALLVRSRLGWAYLTSHRGQLKVLAAVVSVALFALMVKSPGMESMGMATVGYSLLALFFVTILLLALTRPEGRLGTLLAHRWLRWLGDIAYGTYLLHVGVLGVCFGLVLRRAPQMTNLADLAVTVLAGLATLALARASWLYFEKPLVARGHVFHY